MIDRKGFTMAEIMVVVFIIGLLAIAGYIATMPYFQRSRDAGRLTQVQSYASVFSTYRQSADIFPTTFGSGGVLGPEGKCISEIFTRDNQNTPERMFATLSKGVSNPPGDPLGSSAIPIPPCAIAGSYFYDRLINPLNQEQVAIVATRLESIGTANLATGTYLITDSQAEYLFQNMKKGTVPPGSPDAIYFMALK